MEIYIISVMKSLVGNYKNLNYKDFCYKNNIFLSQEVLSLLEDGWRLTCNYNAPCENDFK